MSNSNYDEITVKQIKERLDQLGVEYDDKAKKPELFELLNNIVEGENSSADTPKSKETKQAESKDNNLTKAQLRPAQVRGKDSLAIAESVRDLNDQRKAEKIQKLLATKGYHWYLCQARTVLRDGRVCRRGYHYPIHEDEVATLGTFKYVDPEGKDKNGQPVTEIRPRFTKQTPEEALTEQQREEEIDANDFVG